MDKIDGLDLFKSLFSNDDELINHLISGILFFKRDVALSQGRGIMKQIEDDEAIPVRYNSNGAFFLKLKTKTTTPHFKSRGDASKITSDENYFLYHRETEIRICFDKDGNYNPKRAILEHTGHKVSCGTTSTVVNYVIAHIWNKTNNPLYFNLLWNICLIPSHCAYMTDKREDSDEIVRRVKDLIKAISIELYKPNRIMNWRQDVLLAEDFPPEESFVEARKLILDGKIKFLSDNEGFINGEPSGSGLSVYLINAINQTDEEAELEYEYADEETRRLMDELGDELD